MKFSQLFVETSKELEKAFQNEKKNHFHEGQDYQKYRDSMMKKHGFSDWGKASKDKEFMDALDSGWNADDEAGKDGLNEGKTNINEGDYTSALSIMLDGDEARIDIFRPNGNGWKGIGSEDYDNPTDTANAVKRMTGFGKVSISIKGNGSKKMEKALNDVLGKSKHIG